MDPSSCMQTNNKPRGLSLSLSYSGRRGLRILPGKSLSLSPSSPSNNLFCCSQKRMRVVGGRKLNRCTAYYSTHTVDGMVNTLPSRSIEKCGRIVGERERGMDMHSSALVNRLRGKVRTKAAGPFSLPGSRPLSALSIDDDVK